MLQIKEDEGARLTSDCHGRWHAQLVPILRYSQTAGFGFSLRLFRYRVYVPEVFRAALVTCDVVQVPSYCLNVSDHKPLLFTMQVCNGGRSPRSWRMDPTILHDEECIKYMGTEVAASIAEVDVLDPATWDRLKKRWRLISEEAGKERHARITSRMNETLRRIQIVERGGTSTQAMRDYVDTQKRCILTCCIRERKRLE